MRHRLLGILCIAAFSGILVAGLWPFHSPRNAVTWLKDHNGLRIGDYGTVMSTGAFNGTGSGDEASCSIELWLEPATDNGGTILSFYVPDNPNRFSLYQSHTDFALQSRSSISPDQARVQRIEVSDVFLQGRPVFVTVTSGVQGTVVYVNGTRPVFVTVASGVQGAAVYTSSTLPGAAQVPITACDCTGRLIVGDSPRRHGAWSGQVWGLAIYSSELAAPAVRRHYDTWTKMGRPDIAGQDRTAALYLFDERAGDVVHNRVHTGADLFIPESYTVLDKGFLEPDWDEFSMSWGYWENNFKNIAGFVPLGLCFSAYLALVRKSKRAGLVTVIIGGAVSLTIEVLQGYLPTRDSGTTDLITNTLGTWIGVMLYHAARAQWERHRHISKVLGA